MKTVEMKFFGGLTVCSIGFGLLVAALVYKDDFRGLILLLAGIVAVLGCMGLMERAYNQAKKKERREKDEEEQRHMELITELKGIREDLNKR